MRLVWYRITGGPEKLWALYDDDVIIAPYSSNSSLLGYVAQNKNSTWGCFPKCKFLRDKPSRKSAMILVQSEVRSILKSARRYV